MFIVLEYEMYETQDYVPMVCDMRFHRADSYFEAKHLMYKLYSDEIVKTVHSDKQSSVYEIKAVMTTENGRETIALFCDARFNYDKVRVYQIIPEDLFFTERPNLFEPDFYYDWKWYNEDYWN